jgi:polyisoprenoid-binding protein YceI
MRSLTLRSTPAVLLVLGLSACDTDPGKDKPHATVSESVAASAAPAADGVPFAFSNDGSKLEFVGAKVTKKHDGKFNTFSGTVRLVDGDPTKSTVSAEIDLTSLEVDAAKLTTHLKSEDFFDVTKFPKAKFSSTSIKAGGTNGASHTVTGNLDLHGVTKSISFPATITASADKVDVQAEFAINRKDFGIEYPGAPDDLIEDQVLIKLGLSAKKS